jgi:hypothetical protein
MFIELTEFFRCPADHPEAHCVLVPLEMAGRTVVRGTLGCPVCRREYAVTQAIVRFGPRPPQAPAGTVPGGAALQALTGLASPGGYLVLVGSAARAATALAAQLEGVHLVGVNAPADVTAWPGLTLVEAERGIPLRSRTARGVVLGGESAVPPWIEEAARVLLPGLRLVALAEVGRVDGVEPVAGGPGVWVGQKGK